MPSLHLEYKFLGRKGISNLIKVNDIDIPFMNASPDFKAKERGSRHTATILYVENYMAHTGWGRGGGESLWLKAETRHVGA
jgi:hypothetical protein